MSQSGHRYTLEIISDSGELLDQLAADINWEPPAECTRFTGIRRGQIPAVMATGERVVQPVWHPKLERPYVCEFYLTVFGDNGEQVSAEIPLSYVGDLARRASARLVEKGVLQAGSRFHYRVFAVEDSAATQSEPSAAPSFSVEEVPRALPLHTGCLLDALEDGLRFGTMTAGDMPVFIPHHVLTEASVLARQAGANETGGILIGHLLRGPGSPEIFAKITAQIPAKHTRTSLTKLTFTADTWAAVRGAISQRGQDEIQLGWWHSHSFLKELCRDCERRGDGTCTTNPSFVSVEDVALHRTCFPRAFSLALVISDSPCGGLGWELFGWRCGMVVSRGFHITEALQPAPRLVTASIVNRESQHGKN